MFCPSKNVEREKESEAYSKLWKPSPGRPNKGQQVVITYVWWMTGFKAIIGTVTWTGPKHFVATVPGPHRDEKFRFGYDGKGFPERNGIYCNWRDE